MPYNTMLPLNKSFAHRSFLALTLAISLFFSASSGWAESKNSKSSKKKRKQATTQVKRSTARREIAKTREKPDPIVHASPGERAPQAAPAIEVESVEDGVITFKSNQNGVKAPPSLKVELSDLKYLGPITVSGQDVPYFLFSGRPCQNCSHDSALHLVRPGQNKHTTYIFPGKILDHRDRSLLMESRGFFGRCLNSNPNPVLVFFQKEKVDRRHGMQSSVLIAEPTSDRVNDRLLERGLPNIKNTLKWVKSKHCREIEGRNRFSLTKPLDVNLRWRSNDDKDDESEDRTKENQTDAELSDADAQPAARSR